MGCEYVPVIIRASKLRCLLLIYAPCRSVELHDLRARPFGKDQPIGHAMRLGQGDANKVWVDILPDLGRDDSAIVQFAICEQFHRVKGDIRDSIGSETNKIGARGVVVSRYAWPHHDEVKVMEQLRIHHFRNDRSW